MVINIFESLSIDEFVDWLDEHGSIKDSPWLDWWDKTYCENCEPEYDYLPFYNKKIECSFCELNGKCRYFQDMNDVPDNKQIIKMWLLSDSKNF